MDETIGMDETPKKIVDSGEKCFLCSEEVLKNHRVFIFGRSAIDLAGLIKTGVDEDVNKYLASYDLFICKKMCYKLLLKLAGALNKCQEIKDEVRELFNSKVQLRRTKRLLRSEETNEGQETMSMQAQQQRPPLLTLTQLTSATSSHISSSTNPPGRTTCKASKSIQFTENPTPALIEQSATLHEQSQRSSKLYRLHTDTDCVTANSVVCPCREFVLNAYPPTFSDVIATQGGSLISPQLPLNSSTPNGKVSKFDAARDVSGTVKISINHPSKTVNKTLDGNYKSLGKALCYGPPSRIATAVMKCEPVRKQVIQKVLGIVSREVGKLCSRKNPSMLRKTGKDDLMKFSLEQLCEDWKEKAPLFYSFLPTSCVTKSTRDVAWLPSVAIAGSVLLKQRNGEMSATANILGILLKSRSTEANLARLTKLKVTCSNKSILAKLDKLGENHDIALKKVKERITHENVAMKEKLQTLNALTSSHTSHGTCPSSHENILKIKNEIGDLQKSSHPGFIIAFDNIDVQLQRKNMTMSAQNKDYHWVNHKMVNNRVSGCDLPANEPKADLNKVQNMKFIPNIAEHEKQRFNYIVLVSRMLVDYFEAFGPLKNICIQHIPHKYQNSMSQKSTKVPLGVIFKNENVNEDMLNILKQFHSYLPSTGDGGFDGELFVGDQLTIERAVNIKASVANGYTAEDRLEGINLQLGDWHAGVKLLTMIYHRFFTGKSEGESSTLFSDRTLINRRNVTGDPHAAYRPNRDFLQIVIKSRVIVAAMKVLGFESKSGIPTKFPLPPNLDTITKSRKLDYLMEASAKIVDEYIFESIHLNQIIDSVLTEQERENLVNAQQLTEDGRFPCRFQGCDKSFKYNRKTRRNHEMTHNPPPDIPDINASDTSSKSKSSSSALKRTVKDDVFNYNCALLTDGFLFLNFLDAVCEGDGMRIMQQYKYIMLYCKADGSHSTKYALECLYQFFLVHALLSPRDSERFIWNRSVNNSCQKGSNIPLDLDVEHSNNFIKQGIKNLGPNVSESAISRISRAETATRTISENLDESVHRFARSCRHTKSSDDKDLQELVKRALEVDILTQHEDRSYKHFAGFKRGRLENLDVSAMFKWINQHKKNISLAVKAR